MSGVFTQDIKFATDNVGCNRRTIAEYWRKTGQGSKAADNILGAFLFNTNGCRREDILLCLQKMRTVIRNPQHTGEFIMNNTLDKNGIDPKFKDVKVGDYIFMLRVGVCRAIKNTANDHNYPLMVEKNNIRYSLTLGGRVVTTDVCASAWTFNPFDPDFVMPYNCPFTRGQVLMGRSTPMGDNVPFKFHEYDTTRAIACRGTNGLGYLEARELTEEEAWGKK